MFSGTNFQDDRVEIKDPTPSTVQIFLKWMHQRQIKANINWDEAIDVLYLANKYDVNDLQQKCETVLFNQMAPGIISLEITVAFQLFSLSATIKDAAFNLLCKSVFKRKIPVELLANLPRLICFDAN